MKRLRKISAVLMCAWAFPAAALAQQTSPPPPPAPLPTVTPSGNPSEPPGASPLPSPPPSLSPLVATPASIATNVGLQQNISIAGATGPVTATFDNKVASVSITGTTITLGPLRNGTATLHVVDSSNNASVEVPVRIAPNAGTIAPQVFLKVTGANPDPAFIAAQAALALTRATSVQPRAVLQLSPIAPPAAPLPVGSQTIINVPVTIAGGAQYLDVSGTTQIAVSNVAAAPFAPSLLFYSDDPERILGDGVLWRGTVTGAAPVRLYDYHENGTRPRHLLVALTTPSTATSSVQVVERFAGPNPDVMTVGHAVTRDFLINKTRNQGVVFDIAGNAPLFMHDVSMNQLDGVASAIDVNVLAGGPVTVTVLAVSAGVNPATLLDSAPLPGDGRNRHGVFALGNYGTKSLAYAAGAQDVTIDIGDREPTLQAVPPQSTGKDFGDYGVLFNLTFALTNPTALSQTVYLYEAPRGGPARANYLIDADPAPVELGCATSARAATDAPHRYQIRSFVLAPGASETHTVLTMTDGGSNLPITVGMTTTPPAAAVPPISAPDGCFPKP
ncbi:MAG: hypothetical protein M3126_11255 [Candidatus Eremiobacteraeota bacterium]|nr:hypothetical protein [Candidatus Eremiobacteraeota bacterium]